MLVIKHVIPISKITFIKITIFIKCIYNVLIIDLIILFYGINYSLNMNLSRWFMCVIMILIKGLIKHCWFFYIIDVFYFCILEGFVHLKSTSSHYRFEGRILE